MDIQAATPEQIAAFKMAAARRYAERGVEPELANQLFDMQMAKVASELGFGLDKEGKKKSLGKKLKGNVKKGLKQLKDLEGVVAGKKAELSPRVDKLASALAVELGIKRG